MIPYYYLKNKAATRLIGLCVSSLILLTACPVGVRAQSCNNFSLQVEYVTHSDCQSNGVIKVKLVGADVGNLSNPQYSINSISYAEPLADNDGLFTNLPPGTYTVQVEVFCNNAFKISKQSAPIDVTTSYVVPNVDVLARNPSLECRPSGSFKLHIADGKGPYKMVITSSPADYTGPTTFPNIPAGDTALNNLAHGQYSFYIEDACQYRIIKNDIIGVINHSYNVQVKRHAHTCLPEGQVEVKMSNGAPPYTVTISGYPPEYTGQTVFTNITSSPFLIDTLPKGNYKFEVKDACTTTPDIFNITIDEKPLAFPSGVDIAPTNICDWDGSIRFSVPDGVPRFKLEIDRPGSQSDTTIIQSSPNFNITGLASGFYHFVLTDSCHVDTIKFDLEVPEGTMTISNIITQKTTDCPPNSNGEVSFKINGGKKPYKIEVSSKTGSTPAIPTVAGYNGGTYSRNDLPADTFKLKVTDDCGVSDSSFFVINANDLNSIKIDSVSSIGCLGTGAFKVVIADGKPPYIITITSGPPTYNGGSYPNIVTSSFGGGPSAYVLGGLPPGHYTVEIEDACGSTLNASFNILDLSATQGDIPTDPFGPYLHPPTANDNNCKNVRVPVNILPFYPEWQTNPQDVYEVGFYLSNDPAHNPSPNPALLNWKPVTRDASNFMPDTLPQTYRYMRDNNVSLVAVLRLKVNDAICIAPMVIDTIKIYPIENEHSADQPACDGFRIGFNQYTDHRGLICYPYDAVLRDKDNNLVVGATLSGINSAGWNYFPNKVPYGKYYIDFTDKEGTTWRDSVEMATWKSNMTITHTGNKNLTCDSYTAMFNTSVECKPYRWELFNQHGLIKSSPGTISIDNIEMDLLKYDTIYQILLIGNTQDSLWSATFSYNRNILANYQANQDASLCTLGTGYIKINRTGAPQDLIFQPGTKIIYLSGLTVPVNDTVEITTGITEVFPFSVNPYALSYDTIAPDIYTFKVIDDCGLEHPLSIDFKVYSYDTLTYVASPDCERGTTVIPNATLSYFGDASSHLYYNIVSAPPGVTVPPAIQNGGSFLLKVSGDYIIEMSTWDGSQFCPQDSFSISFKLQKVRLDLDALKKYICGSPPGYIEVNAIEGSGDYTYVLYDENIAPGHIVESNNTGEFHYGQLGETYQIWVIDNQCGRSFIHDITMIDLRDKFISATSDVCEGHFISLSSLPVSDTYLWTGPNGFVSHAKDTTFGPVSLADSGRYYITVYPKGCTGLNHYIDISVYRPDEPKINDTIVVCINTTPEQLTAIPLPGHVLQWFDADTVALAAAPTPQRSVPDTTIFYVKQSNYINCESSLREIVFIVEQLPDTVALAYSNDICRFENPLLTIHGTHPGYLYRIYDSGGNLAGVETALVDTLVIASNLALSASEIFRVEVETRHGCTSSQRSHVPVKVIHPPAPTVYPVLHCLNTVGVPALQADSTPGNRLQWIDVDGFTPLASAPVPPTNAVGTFIYSVVQIDTLYGCPGDTASLQVIIAPLPHTQISPDAPTICRRTAPHIIINSTYDQYRYQVFDYSGNMLFDALADNSPPLDLYDPSYTLNSDDAVYIKVIDTNGCVSPDSVAVPIPVVIPPLPEVFDSSYCLYAAASPLRAIPSEDYYIQWYELDGSPTLVAPVPPTSPLDTVTYMISQKHISLHCESDTMRSEIRIMPLPDTVALALAPDICPGQYPTFIIPQTEAGYIYNVYSESGRITATDAGAGGELKLTGDEQLLESTSYFVEVVNLNECASYDRSTVRVAVVNDVYIEPERIPRYEREIRYSVQLLTNGVAPYEFSLLTPLPYGFDLSDQGLITGSAPRNGKIDPVPFLVRVTDADGCTAEREYMLESDVFIPQVFTPNGDGKNDVFMTGHRLVIFDRLGIKIFEGDNGWDGTYKDGRPAPADTYFYLLFYEDENLNTEGRKKGYITLVRRR